MIFPETHSLQGSVQCSFHGTILDSRVVHPGQKKLPAVVCHGESLASPLVTFLLNCWPWGHVRGWLEGGLEAQGIWVGKLGVCVGRLVGLGD